MYNKHDEMTTPDQVSANVNKALILTQAWLGRSPKGCGVRFFVEGGSVASSPVLVMAFVVLMLPATLGFAENRLNTGSCRTNWDNHGVAETTIVYHVDDVIAAGDGPFLPMDDDRNTVEYRALAFDFFAEQFGVILDPRDPSEQQLFDEEGRVAVMRPTKFGRFDRSHQIYAIDAQKIPKWRGRFPVTSVAFRDDGYFVFVGAEGFKVYGSYGGIDGVILPPNTVFLLGEYRMFDDQDRLMDTILYFSETPAFPIVDPGADDPTVNYAINCKLHSDLFGEGLTAALGKMTTLADGSTDLDFRYTMRFPARIDEADVSFPKCDRVRALPPIDGADRSP